MDIYFFNRNDEKYNDVMDIRYSVFTLEQGIPVSEERDEYDFKDDTLYCLLNDGEAVSTGRIIKNSDGYKIGRTGTLKKCRGKGYGAVLVNALCDKVAELGGKQVNVEAQLQAIPFYEGVGFNIVSDEIIIDRNIEHKKMVRK